MRYINLLDKVSRVKTTRCFIYNNTIFFVVPRQFVSQAIGRNAENLRIMQDQMNRRIKIVAELKGKEDIKRYIEDVISPAQFKDLKIENNELIITAGNMQNKANLLGRGKTRLEELQEIVKDDLGLQLKVI
jgi:transcription antitermination factor NusA-like protein